MDIERSLRASDADRERVAERLRQATAEGRLAGDELEERLEALYAARTYGDLDALLVDIPVRRSPGGPQRGRLRRSVGVVSAVALVAAVLGLVAIMRGHNAVAAVGTGPRRLSLPGPLPGQHEGLIVGILLGVVLTAVLLTCAAMAWALMDSRSRRHVRAPGSSPSVDRLTGP